MASETVVMNESMAAFVTPLGKFEMDDNGHYRAEWMYSHVNHNRAIPAMVHQIANNLSNSPMGVRSGHMARIGLGMELVWSKTDKVSNSHLYLQSLSSYAVSNMLLICLQNENLFRHTNHNVGNYFSTCKIFPDVGLITHSLLGFFLRHAK